jgi:membrane protease YdiL (CAAX protease family)
MAPIAASTDFRAGSPATALCVLGACLALRIADVFLIRSDQWFGEQVVTKAGGLLILIAYVWFSSLRPEQIGFRAVSARSLVLVGLGLTALVLTVAFAAQMSFVGALGSAPNLELSLQGFPFNAGSSGHAAAAVVGLIGGNLLNALMEEGVFRGLLLTHLANRMSLHRANVTQAIAFGLWHIVWPLRDWLDGNAGFVPAMSFGLGYVLVAAIVGWVWGYLFIWSRSLWIGIVAHAFHNWTLNVLRVTSSDGSVAPVAVLSTVVAMVFVVILPLARRMLRAPPHRADNMGQ